MEDVNFKYTDISLNRACQMSFNQALKVIELNGGSTEGDAVTIKTQVPQPVRLEQSFEGHWPVAKKNINKTLADLGEFSFEGKGAVFSYRFVLPKGYSVTDYKAQVEVLVDGALYKTVSLPASGNGRGTELCQIWDLPLGEHKVSFNWTNKTSDLDLIVGFANIFTEKK